MDELRDNTAEFFPKMETQAREENPPIRPFASRRRVIDPGIGGRKPFTGIVTYRGQGTSVPTVRGEPSSSGSVNLGRDLPSPGELAFRELVRESVQPAPRRPTHNDERERYPIFPVVPDGRR